MTIPKHLLNAKICNEETCERLNNLNKENKELRRIYMNLAKKYEERGDSEMGGYMLAQIGAVPTFVVEDPPLNVDWKRRCELGLKYIRTLRSDLLFEKNQFYMVESEVNHLENILWRGEE